MNNTITRYFCTFVHSRWYWLLYIVGGISLMAVALIHQYVFNEQPCVMCIQVRLWITLFIIVSVFGLVTRHTRVVNSIFQFFIFVIAVGLVERSYKLLGTERGFVTGDCSFDLGLPAWFAVEKWLPSLYQVETTCGYTPEVLFGITMAEGLMVMSVGLLILSGCAALVSFKRFSD